MAKHYHIVPATFGLDIAVTGPFIHKILAPEKRKQAKRWLPFLDAAYEAGLSAQAGAPSPGEGTQPAGSDKTN